MSAVSNTEQVIVCVQITNETNEKLTFIFSLLFRYCSSYGTKTNKNLKKSCCFAQCCGLNALRAQVNFIFFTFFV